LKRQRRDMISQKPESNKDSDGLLQDGWQEKIKELDLQIKHLNRDDQLAAVDSELSLLLAAGFALELWQPNPYFVGNRNKSLAISRYEVVFVSRLDAPSTDLVRRIIDDSLVAERQGLQGTAYFDARWPRNNKAGLSGYGFYDQSLHLAGERVTKAGVLPVVVNQEGRLFKPGEAPGAALYCGWYSLANYVDAFDWIPGAVGYHIASQECQSLRGSGNYWCKRMLEDGAAAVIGPVAEPYVQAFPVPEVFFSYLTDGYYSLVEAYYLSLPYLSWQMVLVGDPLYRPFAVR